ncbi:hypothetical protein [Mesorhizobium muleiense]|uniref:hypothetical protein n=1 Tax=Mesorhizobium muleiense TaxID=1004279 RepID=UPI001F210E2F|nr:hypothetical protein [Mesorhizobium muleiense]MCF6110013.1 hypothetical protein [Mesorhizobium muleiense]
MPDEKSLETAADPANARYDVSVAGDGLSIKRSVDTNVALAIVQLIMGGNPMFAPAPEVGSEAFLPRPQAGAAITPATAARPTPGRMSVRNFMDESGAKLISAKIVAIGAYLRDQEGQTEFSREDVQAQFRSARETLPTNLPRDFQNAIRQGWIAEDPRSKNQFYVTDVGDSALASKFEGLRSSPGRKKRAKKARPKEAAADNGSEE